MPATRTKPIYYYEIYIGAPIGRVRRGLTDGDLTTQCVYGRHHSSRANRFPRTDGDT
jgi:hypothetical protein